MRWIDAYTDSDGTTICKEVAAMEPKDELAECEAEEDEPQPKVYSTPWQKVTRIQETEILLEKLQKEKVELEEIVDAEDFESTRIICLTMKNAGRVIDAIKYYKIRYNVGLKHAKDDVDAM
jgi:hypothetical protein